MKKESGIYVEGKIKSVNMTTAGKNEKMSWGNSLKLKFELPMVTEKTVDNEIIELLDPKVMTVKIKFETQGEMLKKYKEYIQKKGQNIEIKANMKFNDGDEFWGELPIENEIKK